MTGWVRAMAVAALGLMSAGWNGSGGGDLVWEGPGQQPTSADVEAVGAVDGEVQAIVTAELPGGRTGVLSVLVRPGALNRGRVSLPTPDVRIGYAEYDRRGLTVFLSDRRPVGGTLRALYAGDVEVAVTADFVDRDDPHLWRRVEGLRFALVPVDDGDDAPVVREGGGSSGGVVVVNHDSGGCSGDDDWDDDDGWDDSDDGWDSGSSGGGCDGDDLDSSSSDSGGGCEGDDMDSGGSSGCEGDAVAAGRGRRIRSPWLARAVTWLPWFLVFLFIRLARRDPFRRRQRA